MQDLVDHRPDPDALLAQVTAAEARATRARLKIFFGASPGVGKTYAMLEAARRALADGVDVVVGIVETHGRAETAGLLAGLPSIPRRTIAHRGVTLHELDVDATLVRRPALLLVDELAHTNAPGSRHVKRWQDVVDLLDAGIDVWTTLNVQHIESLGDVIQQITGIKVRETLPDAVIERADELELVDLSPDELLVRLAEGKVYVPEQAARATQHFFQRGNLLALRELALRQTAERVDAEVLAYRRDHGIAATWPTRERIVVCIGASPGSERLIRATKRTSEGLHAPWTAVTVEPIGAPPLGDIDRGRLEAHLRLADQLGGEVVRLRGAGVAATLLAYARAHNVTRIVAGKPTHARWRDRLRGSLLDDLIRGSGSIEIHVIAPIETAPPPPAPSIAPERAPASAFVWSAIAITITTAICLLLYAYISVADVTMLYLVAIMLASLLGRGPAVVAASLAVASFDLCFVPPRFTFSVSDARYVLTFVVMFGCGLAISSLMSRLRRQERDAVVREGRTAALLAFTREVAMASDVSEVAVVATRHLEEGLDAAAAVLVPDEEGGLVAAAGLMPLAGQEVTVARWAFDHRRIAGHDTDTLPGARVLAIPLVDGAVAVGVIALQRRASAPIEAAHVHLLDALARQTTLALGRVRLAHAAKAAALRARTEELRSSLLSAVSHDLRTPLAVITGAATSLRDDGRTMTAEDRDELASTIVADASRLERVLANLLQLTRVETGFEPRRESIPAEELVGAALTRLEDSLRTVTVEVDVEPDLTLFVDPVLFEQVLINLLENALKHGRPPLYIGASATRTSKVLEVGDRGDGVPEPTERLFDKFVRASPAAGAGLGLAVVRAIVSAHGGRVAAANRPGGGAMFSVRMPVT